MVRGTFGRALALVLILCASLAWADPRVRVFASSCRNGFSILSLGKRVYTYEIDLANTATHLPDSLAIQPEKGFINQFKYITKNAWLSQMMGRWLTHKETEAPSVGPAQASVGGPGSGSPVASEKVDLGNYMKVNHLYTFVIQDGKLRFTSGGNTIGESVYSKHMNLSMYKDVQFAGEMYLDDLGRLHVNNASGTYKPKGEMLDNVKHLFEENFTARPIVTHARGAQAAIGGRDFVAPEFEAKFETPGWETFENLKKLDGQKVTLTDSEGHPVEYVLKTWATYKNTDTFFDTADLDIYHKGGLLRERRRFKDTTGDNLRDIMFQAKDEADREGDRDEAVFARNEVRGSVAKDADKWDGGLEDRLANGTSDEAVQFARKYAAGDKPLQPVLRIDQQRTYIFAYPTKGNPVAKNIPVFQISVDDVTSTGLVGNKAVDRRPQVEIEIFGELPFGLNKMTEEKQRQLDQLTSRLQNDYKLIPSTSSKYGAGVAAAVLGDGSPEAPRKAANGQ